MLEFPRPQEVGRNGAAVPVAAPTQGAGVAGVIPEETLSKPPQVVVAAVA